MTTGCMKANSQRVIITKSGAVTTRRVDDHSPFSLAYNSVNRYLGEKSNNPQRMTFTCGQSQNGNRFVSLSMNEVSTETALDLGDSRNFEAAFDMAENRKSLHEACEKAKRFYMEHILYRNPFPPKNKFSIIIEKSKKVKKDNPKKKSNEDSLHTARTTSSALSLLEGTMSLTSMSSHSQLSATTPSHPINLKTPKKRSTRFRNQPPDSQAVHKNKAVKSPPKTATPPPPAKPKEANDEHRLMNTFNTTE
ncbi:hypothetical protein L5515_013519 [Caenorhabditis briggsae]|uniref:Uncharacterized protein n=1 Tax=Caenorhabditis briggsae TaxID=6238 RepID=A0AAE9E9B5_CAEBR|nr:hypothetical protein L5515_013519 [Caenorhabditis briggsae]